MKLKQLLWFTDYLFGNLKSPSGLHIYWDHYHLSFFHNNFMDQVVNSRVLKYADIYELVINLKKGKTETMLFGTRKRLSSHHIIWK